MPLYILHVLPKQKQNKKTQIAWVQPIKEIQEDTQTDRANCKAIQTHKSDRKNQKTHSAK